MGLFNKNTGHIGKRWEFNVKSPVVAGAAVGTVNNKAFIVLATKEGRVVCLNADGKLLWEFKTNEELSATEEFFVDEERVHSIDAPPLIADVNGDGIPEVLFGSEMGTLYCLALNGKQIWKYECKGSIRAAPAAIDINHDGHLEILIGSMENKLHCISGTGQHLFTVNTSAPVESVPAMFTLGQKTLIVFGNNDGDLTAVTPSQEEVWKINLGSKITAAPQQHESSIILGTHSGLVYRLDQNGEIMWKYKTLGSIYSAVAIADLDHDGEQEIVLGSCDNNIYALTMNGDKFWSYETDFWITETPIITDINGDGRLEVVAGSYDHNVYILDSEGQYMMDYVPGLSGIVPQAGHYSSILTSEPGELTGKKLWQFKLPDLVVGCALLDSQGKQSVVVTSKEGNINVLEHTQ